jgi:hypothetical protein
MRNPLNSPTITYRLHAYGAVTWMILVIPSWYLWRNSIFWVIFISLYANFVSHWGAWQAVRAELVAARAEMAAQLAAAVVAAADLDVEKRQSDQLGVMLEILYHLDDRTDS